MARPSLAVLGNRALPRRDLRSLTDLDRGFSSLNIQDVMLAIAYIVAYTDVYSWWLSGRPTDVYKAIFSSFTIIGLAVV